MGANVNTSVLMRPKIGTIAFGLGLVFALFAWLRSDPEYVSTTSRSEAPSLGQRPSSETRPTGN